MKVLLTGGSGMVGTNIREHSSAQNFQLLTPTRTELNLFNREAVKKYLSTEMPDLIIHAAGRVGGIQANISNPVGFLAENVDMGLNLILSAQQVGIPNLINLASSCMYPRDALNPLHESIILQGGLEPTNEGYALAKIVSTRACEYVSKEDSKKNYKTIIPCNLYGRYDKFDPENSHLIPAIIKKIDDAMRESSQEIEIWGDGEARREFMYAGDLADFIFYALQRIDEMPQNINVGLGFDYSVTEYYKAVAEVIGFEGGFKFDLTKPVGMKKKLVDTSQLSSFGWSSATDLSDGLRKTYAYYKEKN